MKTSLLMIGALSLVLVSGCGQKSRTDGSVEATVPETSAETAVELAMAEAGCGQCLFGLEGKIGCDLAVRFGDKSYFVDGFNMGNFGDPHASDGMCETVRKAKVTGQVVDGRFAATGFDVLPAGQ